VLSERTRGHCDVRRVANVDKARGEEAPTGLMVQGPASQVLEDRPAHLRTYRRLLHRIASVARSRGASLDAQILAMVVFALAVLDAGLLERSWGQRRRLIHDARHSHQLFGRALTPRTYSWLTAR
jgi:hypothetical protein